MRPENPDASDFLVATALDELRKVKRLADKAIAQLSDDELHAKLDDDSNSVAVLMRHMAGNMRSRWIDFLASDGEKPDRQRDREFEDPPRDRTAILADWENGWQAVFDALASLVDSDLRRTVHIRSEPHTVHKAICRQMVHYAGHAYQIVLIARHLKGPSWQTLSIPRGQSEEFNRRMQARTRQ
jgi:uncharacterized damage-inducible protein DinB